MGWSERQRRMLAEMGITLWSPSSSAMPSPDEVLASDSPATTAEPAPHAQAGEGPGAQVPVASARSAPVGGSPIAPAQRGPQGSQRLPLPVRPGDAPSAPSTAKPSPLSASLDAEAGWDALRAEVAQCRACGLCEGRRNTVFGVGHPHAHLMVVGEAPGEQEDLRGEPFVGPAGQLLDAMLRAIGLSRGAQDAGGSDAPGPIDAAATQVFIANTLKCRPPNNRNPQPEELAACEPFLQRQIALVQPKVILAMGRFAVQSLLRSSEPVGKLRGRVHAYQGVPLVVTYHPAYLLRNLPDKARAWDDLCAVAALLDA